MHIVQLVPLNYVEIVSGFHLLKKMYTNGNKRAITHTLSAWGYL